MFYADSLGVGAFAVIGAQNAVRQSLHPMVCVLSGMFTATFGGVIRDTLTKRDVHILHSSSEIYASTALGGATAYLLVRSFGGPTLLRVAAGIATSIGMR